MTPAPRADLGTHQVLNQPEPDEDLHLWRDDSVLQMLLADTDAHIETLADYGRMLGERDMREAARDANRHPPELRLFDNGGRRLDEVRFHPAYHRFMAASTAAGYHAVAWESRAGGHLTHACMVYLASQIEPGHCCPLTMTYAAVPLLASSDTLRDTWHERALNRQYDPSVRPVHEKQAVTIGMAMTEKQGGSDVRANTTRAEREGDIWRLTGHKWFCSAPMSDAFLTLAQTPAGLSCFLVPRWLDGTRNDVRILRLKDKLGNRSNASSEIEYHGACAYPLGADGDGLRTIVEMVHHTRLDTALAPAGLMRAAIREAHHWARQREVFGKRLIGQPLMRVVLADLVLDWAGSLALGLHVAACFDGDTDDDRTYARIGVALAKFMANKLCPMVVAEAMEVLGGMGYIEDTALPLLYREAPLNGIWEGSANVICLDALRTLVKVPASATLLKRGILAGTGRIAGFDRAVQDYQARWRGPVAPAQARQFVEHSATLLTASVLIGRGYPVLAQAYVSTRLVPGLGRVAGRLDAAQADAVLARCLPD